MSCIVAHLRSHSLNIVSLSDMIEGSYRSWDLCTTGQLVDGLQQKWKPVFIKWKWNHVVFYRVTIWSFHPVKTTFLRSKELDRLVYLDPPKEVSEPPGCICKLSRCVYGLTDASRCWYLILREELLKSGAVVSKYDQAIFIWYFGNKLHGIITTHVDDFCFAGLEIFQIIVIDRLHRLFKIQSEEVAEFQYIGLNIKKNRDNVRLGQNKYKKIKMYPSRRKQKFER